MQAMNMAACSTYSNISPHAAHRITHKALLGPLQVPAPGVVVAAVQADGRMLQGCINIRHCLNRIPHQAL